MDKSPNIAGSSTLFCTATTVPAELELLGPDMREWDNWARLWALVDLDLLLGVQLGQAGMSDMEEDFKGDFCDSTSNLPSSSGGISPEILSGIILAASLDTAGGL